MDFSSMSRVPKDLLLEKIHDTDTFVGREIAKMKDLEAPSGKSKPVPHKLLMSATSDVNSNASKFIEKCRTVYGTAFTEHYMRQLASACKINRGPDGIFGSSRLHLDLLLRKDETIEPADYLNYYYQEKHWI